ncbi:MAG: hypothetical protein ACKN9P_16220, partial [Phenylobacterium sp.]
AAAIGVENQVGALELLGQGRGGAHQGLFVPGKGEATAADLEGLGEQVRADVEAQTGVRLDWEIRRIGRRGPAA